jgi:hypothetical protein
MKIAVLYLVLVLVILTGVLLFIHSPWLPSWLEQFRLPLLSILLGGYGGCTYCLRAVYLSASVRKDWNDSWLPWYSTRPIVSLILGGISYVFLRAGLLTLESSQNQDSSYLGFLAVAFIAGLNVDNFMHKIESVAKTIIGIQRTRVGKEDEENGS